MTIYSLTDQQKDLLRKIVTELEEGRIAEPVIPVCDSGGCYILGIDEGFGPNLHGDLDALSDLDLMASRYNSTGDRIYTVKQAGYDAVASDFELPEAPATAQVNIGAIIHEMSGGEVQAIGFADRAEVRQIVNDPQLLEREVRALTNQLIDSVRPDLSGDSLLAYVKTTEDLREQIASGDPAPSLVQRLLASLAFMGDLEGSISLMARAWPYIYPLLVIAAERLAGIG